MALCFKQSMVSDLLLMLPVVVLAVALFLLRVRRKQKYAPEGPPPNAIAVDGSNVMHWGGEPSAKVLRKVLSALIEGGYEPILFFDANVGYVLDNRYYAPRELARLTCGFSGRELLDVCEEAERMRAGEILRDIGREAKSDDEGDGEGEGGGDGESDGEGEIESEAFALPTMKQYTVAVERKAMHVVGRTDERFMSPSILAELAGLESAVVEAAA